MNGGGECGIAALLLEELENTCSYRVDHTFAKKTYFSLKRSPSGKLTTITVESAQIGTWGKDALKISLKM